ncbi:adenosylcobinamide-GDP ribazoletransferase [Methyloligella sp. 2.7D]|uniref:adenosylcobinamide-GDP ribazoletransferase n=1 Tax=unclassified Methyloligella TaxID=2625955 RepID=UPI00157D0164|nr:adenosylcobinamide-GDP ribazoletransferase [Methyloligella sp. GL2]QKP78137.1 adenosylcobinamide-GDP ribazoletransferase [Methyloligella sp. GL2]
MTLSGLIHAFQFLTRLPTPRLKTFNPADLSRAAGWFPLAGLVIGLCLAAAFLLGGQISPLLAALFALLVWVWITGALHLDGLGDVADAMGAAHRSPQRFLEVMRDPHIGTFGVVAILLQLFAKLLLLMQLAAASSLAAAMPVLVLIPAWARWGPQVWSLMVPPYAKGTGDRFSWQISKPAMIGGAVVLAALSFWFDPILLAALAVVPAIALYWRQRLGGITGDCLGASIEVTETVLLLLAVIVLSIGG